MGEFVQPEIKIVGELEPPDIREVHQLFDNKRTAYTEIWERLGGALDLFCPEDQATLMSHLRVLEEDGHGYTVGGPALIEVKKKPPLTTGLNKLMFGDPVSNWHFDVSDYETFSPYPGFRLMNFGGGTKYLSEGRIPGLDPLMGMDPKKALYFTLGRKGQRAIRDALSKGSVEIIDLDPGKIAEIPPHGLHCGPTYTERRVIGDRAVLKSLAPGSC
jgi:hypothetical protein